MSDINVDSLSSQLGQQTMATPQEEPKKECVFCAIVQGKMPAKIVADNEQFIAFLDIQPKAAGHIVVVPKRHVLTYDMLDMAEEAAYNLLVKQLILKQRSALGATGYTLISSNGGSSGQAVPHFSAHIIPTYSKTQVELPVMGLIQPQKVPEFVMDDIVRKMKC